MIVTRQPLIRDVRQIAETDAHEGPVYAADEQALYFTSVRRERVSIKRLALADGRVSVVREDANTANGMSLDREGRLVVCEQGTFTEPARITAIEAATGVVGTLVDGNQQYEVPGDVQLGKNTTVIIWCRAFSVLFARAPLRKEA